MNACEKKSKSLLEKPDIRYPVTSGYPAGYPNPDFQNPVIRVSGLKISIRYNPSIGYTVQYILYIYQYFLTLSWSVINYWKLIFEN